MDYFDEYDKWVQDLMDRSKDSDEDLLFSAMALFTLEWKYSLEFAYLVADYMEKEKIKEVDFYTLWALALPLKYDSRLGTCISGDNRMVKERQFLIPDFICEGDSSEEIIYERQKYIELVGLAAIFNTMPSTEDGLLYKDWFKNNTSLEDWASFIDEYEIFGIWNKKEWTNTKIRNTRKILEMIAPIRDMDK